VTLGSRLCFLMATRRISPTIPQITAADVQKAKAACASYRRLACALERAEKTRDAALSDLFSLMGLSFDATRALSPERLAAEIGKRAGIAFSFDSQEAANFAILKVSAGRFPDWKSKFIARIGPAIASEVEASARVEYAYDVVDDPSTAREDVIAIPRRAK
jgi:hypothetical protein